MSGRSSAPSTPGGRPSARHWPLAALWRGSIETFDTVDLGGGFPGATAGRALAQPGTIRARASRVARRDPRRPAPDAPGDRTGTRAGRAGRLARGARAPRPRRGRPPGHPGCGHDRAHPAGAVRRPTPDPRADLAARCHRADARRRPHLRVDRFAGHARPAATPARRSRRDRRRRRLRDVARLHLQRPSAPAAGAARPRRHAHPRPAPRIDLWASGRLPTGTVPCAAMDARTRFEGERLDRPGATERWRCGMVGTLLVRKGDPAAGEPR